MAKRLISSLDDQVDEEIEQAWVDDIKRRKDEIKSGNVMPVSGDEVHKAARKVIWTSG